ncbi:hydrolase (plasmid) [Streptomyces nigrescens]|uniref:Hydrolase n=1 Tax=Streptomyces nigrescens TaxID=1920 RepID=A0ABM8A5U2_STRNI|nr:alpha/beta hydrolase [Streptomyces nigrescens]BDM74004.1 hydrolase [Streptomyces nigrescens]
MNEPTTGTLDVPGATLHYELRGRGPVLLLIPGGAADAGLYAAMTDDLAARYTVVSYDPRGLSRSRLDGPVTDQRVEVWSDDAHRLLELLSPHEAASVLGSSSGAIVALDLLARHPERLHRVVAHEPPLLELLLDPAPHRALFADVRETFRTQGVGAAMARFSEGLGGRPDDGGAVTELPPEIQEMAPRMHANLPVFLEHILCPFSGSAPDVAALRRAADRLVLAVGRDSRPQEALYGPATRLAEMIGGKAVEFPGGHVGCTEYPKEFARQLLDVL